MRIRTIKPEFWTHPVMGRKSDATKLMAIGLLNIADDEGYFYADPKMIRNAIRPFDDDSRITTGSLRDLSETGYILIRNHDTHGPIGKVMSFLAHQVINKPKSSSLKHLHESGIDTVSIPDEARLERKGKEWSREEEWKEKEPEVNSSPNPTTKDKSRGTEEEFRQYAKELNLPENDGFFLLSKFQESNWTKNKGTEAIKDWKATMRVWKASRWLPSQKNITEKGRRGFQDEFKYKQNGHARRPHD